MATFVLGLVILFVGAAIYGKFCEKVFGPDDRETPVYSKQDGIDYIPMRGWKNGLLGVRGSFPVVRPEDLFAELAVDGGAYEQDHKAQYECCHKNTLLFLWSECPPIIPKGHSDS